MVGPDLLVILDGASEPLAGAEETSLERARTPTLDALARDGSLSRLRTVPAGLAPGSEVAIPVLLGWPPTAPVDRGAIEAAAHEVEVPPRERAWRVDVLGGRASAAHPDVASIRRAARALRIGAPAHAVHQIDGHRLLLVGPAPLPEAAWAPYLRVWPEGVAVPRTLDATTLVVAARGACAGVARMLGARLVVPDGATGDTDTALAAKASAATEALTAGAPHVVVHAAGADAAAHERDAAAKVAFLERVDRELIAPLADAVARAGGTLRVCPDHGCDPATGRHDAHPVPCLIWPGPGPSGGRASADAGADAAAATADVASVSAAAPAAVAAAPGAGASTPRRLTERAVAGLAVTDLPARLVVV